MLSYICIITKNMKKMFLKNTVMMMLLIFSQVVALSVLLLAYGMTENTKRDVSEQVRTEDCLNVYTESKHTMGEVQELLESIFKHYNNKIDNICVVAKDEVQDIIVYMRFSYVNGMIVYDEEAVNVLIQSQTNDKGRYFNTEEFNNGAKVVVTSEKLPGCGEICEIGNEEFEVVGYFPDAGFQSCRVVDMPYYAVPANIHFVCVDIELKRLPTVSEYNYFAEKMFAYFGDDCEVHLPERFSNQSKKVYETYIVIGLIMIGISVIVIGTVYGYLLKTQRKDNAILSLCGAKNRTILFMNLVEVVLLCILSYYVVYLINENIWVKKLGDIFTYFEEIFTSDIYLEFGAIYVLAVMGTAAYYICRELRCISDVLKGGGDR